MGGPYIEIERLVKLLEKMKGERFFGVLELEWEDGNVRRVKSTETMKASEIERYLQKA